MTSEHGHTWRIEITPGSPIRRDDAGHVRLPLWLLRDEEHFADLSLRLSSSEAEVLHSQIGQAPSKQPHP